MILQTGLVQDLYTGTMNTDMVQIAMLQLGDGLVHLTHTCVNVVQVFSPCSSQVDVLEEFWEN